MWHVSYVCLFFKFGFYVILKHRNEAEILQDYKIKIHTDFSVDLASLIIPVTELQSLAWRLLLMPVYKTKHM